MFCVLPPCSAAGQLPLPLPLPVQVVRCWKIAMPEVVPLVGATMLTVGLPVMLGAPGLPLLLANTIVTPPVRSFVGSPHLECQSSKAWSPAGSDRLAAAHSQ